MKYQIKQKPRRGLLKIGIFFVVLAISFSVCYYLKIAPVLASPEISKITISNQSAAEIVWPDYGNGQIEVVGFDDAISSHGVQAARPIASITKTITALVVLDKKPINGDEAGPDIELTAADQAIYDKSIADGLAAKPIEVGSKITEKEALQVMMLASAANYAETLAVWAYGSVDAYLVAANAWLADNGLLQTKVVDTSGLDSGNISTPSDLIKLGKLTLGNKALAKIVSTKQATVVGAGTVNNGNRLLGKLGVNGIKTGFTGDAGACLLFSSSIKVGGQTVTIIGSLLGGVDGAGVASDVDKLLTSVQKNIHLVKLISKGQKIGSVTNIFGQTANIKSQTELNAVVWSDDAVKITFNTEKINSIKTDTITGNVEIKIGNKVTQKQIMLSY